MVEVEGAEKVNHPSPWSTVEKLEKQIGVVYFSYLNPRGFAPDDSHPCVARMAGMNRSSRLKRVTCFTRGIPQFKDHYKP